MFQRSDSAIADQFTSQSKLGIAALLATGLQDTTRCFGHLNDLLSLVHGQRQWFFTVDIFSGSHGGNRDQRMPVIDCSTDNYVDILAFQQFSKVFERGGVRPFLLRGGDALFVNVTDSDDRTEPAG